MGKGAAVYVITAYALSIALSLVVGLTGGSSGPLIGLRYLSMVLPAVAVLVVKFATTESPRVDWNRFPIAYLPLAMLLIPVTMHAAMLMRMRIAGPLPWEVWLTPQADGLFHTPVARGWGDLTTSGLAARIAINAVVGLAVISVLAFFEEIGWRGWLLPRLIERWGARRAVLLTSVIWAFWHVPFGLSGIQHIDGVTPARLAFGVPFGVIAAGLVIGWLWVRTESIWIVTIAHGSLNGLGQYAFKYMSDFTVPDQLDVAGAGIAALYLLGGVLLAFGMPRTDPAISATHL